ncbi:hypothetical protein ACK8P5_26540 (plasmid) [Paenibacillus sp. EC2-1]|uniref:hypothetical protein n=1 Tax=Paenibacillus sp. EC2-1 TaxID=3388665 RepID=UPI003BEEBEBA
MKKTTICIECGESVTYKTNRPKRCDRCRDIKESSFQHKKRKPQRSKKEAKLQEVLNDLLPAAEYIDNGYYSWLISPKGSPLQLDRYYPTFKIGFEFNGRQHYEFNPYMHKDRAAFDYLQSCDRRKQKGCDKRGVTLITIKYNKIITRDYILTRLKEAGVMSIIRQHIKMP